MQIEVSATNAEIDMLPEEIKHYSLTVKLLPAIGDEEFIHSLGGEDWFSTTFTNPSEEELKKQVVNFIRDIKDKYHRFQMLQQIKVKARP